MPESAYPYPREASGPLDPDEYEPRSFADVLMEELDLIERRREMIFLRSSGLFARGSGYKVVFHDVPSPGDLANPGKDLPASGVSDVIVGFVGHVLHIRIFDRNQEMILDADEFVMAGSAELKDHLKQSLRSLVKGNAFDQADWPGIIAMLEPFLQILWPAVLASRTAPAPDGAISAKRDAFQAMPASKSFVSKDEDNYLAYARVKSMDQNVAGLAFSGGGIRSATFSVGFLQGLAGLKLLRFFDVLSTVSGGGYAGSWLTTWIRREGDPINVEKQLDPSRIDQGKATRGPELNIENRPGASPVAIDPGSRLNDQVLDEEPEPIRHLRQYSSYLNPSPGLTSADTWTLLAIYLRNVSINFLVLLPLIVAIVAGIRLIAHAFNWVSMSGQFSVFFWVFFLGVVLASIAFIVNSIGIYSVTYPSVPEKSLVSRKSIWRYEIIPISAAAVLMSMSYQPILDTIRNPVIQFMDSHKIVDSIAGDVGYLSPANVLGHGIAFGMLELFLIVVTAIIHRIIGGIKKPAPSSTTRRRSSSGPDSSGIIRKFLSAFVPGFTIGVMIAVTEALLRPFVLNHSTALLALLAPPLFLISLFIGLSSLVAIRGESSTESFREWWARISAYLLMVSVAWVVLLGVVLFGPLVILGNHQLIAAILASGWVGITITGVNIARGAASSADRGNRGLAILVLIAPPTFLLGLLAAISTGFVLLVDHATRVQVQPNFARAFTAYIYAIQQADGWAILGVFAISLISMAIGMSLVNVNLFSLHAMYANRLIRAFLGASRRKGDWNERWKDQKVAGTNQVKVPRDERVLAGAATGALDGGNRNPNPVTQFDPGDDLPLHDLAIGAGDDNSRYWGPMVIFNTAMNLVGGTELAWRDRKAESFALTPIFSGSKTTGYVRTSWATGDNLTVGRAVAISGAAVDPNMNYYQSGPVTALLTIFNARLGVWLKNPNRKAWSKGDKKKPWSASGARYGALLLKEISGQTDQNQTYIHLSDGGHFDNLGVYELVRRRCRYVVAVDVTENPLATSDNLGTLVRLCKVDFGIRIQLDTSPLELSSPNKYSRAHVVIGRIRYDDVDHLQTPGILVYVRCTMTGDEPPDVQQYANLHPEFPRQLTLTDQSFDEDQFESYRELGVHTASSVFEVAKQSLVEEKSTVDEWFQSFGSHTEAFSDGHRKIFSALRNRWAEPPIVRDSDRTESSHAWVQFQRNLQENPELAELSRDLYSELPSLGYWNSSSTRRQELHAMEQAIQMMCDTWEGLGLRGHDDAPINRGWMNAFRRLASTEAFRRFWPLLRSEFGAEFCRFCERNLGVQVPDPVLVPAGDRPDLVDYLGREFAREWPTVVQRNETLNESLNEAGSRYFRQQILDKPIGMRVGNSFKPTSWLILQYPIGYEKSKEPDFEVPLGVIALIPESEGFHLFLWVTRPQRSNGTGEKVRNSPRIAEMILWLKSQQATARVKYPVLNSTSGEDLNRVRWLGFFSLLGFRPQGKPIRGESWILTKTY